MDLGELLILSAYRNVRLHGRNLVFSGINDRMFIYLESTMEGERVLIAGKGSRGRKIMNDYHLGILTDEIELLTEVRKVVKMFKSKLKLLLETMFS